MRLLANLISLAFVLSAPAFAAGAEPETAPATEAPKPAKPPKPKKICRQAEEQSGSRIGSGRICKTEEEWADYDANQGSRRSSRSSRSMTAE